MFHFLAQHKIRITTNLKTKNNQNCQIIKLYESSTTKELKKKHSSRWLGEVEIGSCGGEDAGKVGVVAVGKMGNSTVTCNG